MENAADTLSVEAGSAVWLQYMLFQQRSAADITSAQQGTRKVFMQVRVWLCTAQLHAGLCEECHSRTAAGARAFGEVNAPGAAP